MWEWKLYYQRSRPPLVLFMCVSYHLLNSSISCNVSMWAVISLCSRMILFNLPLLRCGEPNQGAVLMEFTHWCKTLNINLAKEKRWQLITGKILLSSLQCFEWSGSDVCTEAHVFGLYQWSVGFLNQNNKIRLRSVERLCYKIACTTLTDPSKLYKLRVLKKADLSHPLPEAFVLPLLSHGYSLPSCMTVRFKNAFVTTAIGILSK